MRMFAAKHTDGRTRFSQIHPTAIQVRICGYTPAAVDVTELLAERPGCYFAWKLAGGDLTIIQPSRSMLKMCSPDAFKSAIERGEGHIVPVWIADASIASEGRPASRLMNSEVSL